MSFGEALQALRKEAKVTQEQLASYLGVSAQAVSKWENGSYPEGDLIPRIADYFKVSIDYMYGREERRASIEQQVVNELSSVWRSENSYDVMQKEFVDKAHRLLWAIQISSWKNSVDYYARPQHEENSARMSSAISFDEGYSFMRLDKNKDCFLFLRQPEGDKGYERWFSDTTEVREFFGKLADRDNLKVLGFLYTLRHGELASLSTIEKATHVPREKITALFDYIGKSVGRDGESPILEVELVGNDEDNQRAYGVNMTLGGLFVGIFAMADSYVHSPQGYTMQSASRTRSWADRSKIGSCK